MTVDKKELIRLIQKTDGEYELTQGVITQVLDALVSVTHKQTRKGNDVYLRGLGTFGRVTKKAGKALNPNTLEAIRVPRRNLPSFKMSRTWREAMRGGR